MVNVKGNLQVLKEFKTKKGLEAVELKILQSGNGNLQVVIVTDYKKRGWKVGPVDIEAYVFPYVTKNGQPGVNYVAV